ncbi:MAG: chromosomal replication initiator protein DnaA [Alphaproteobacteria bacterium]|nr:chromosomal replication initiator protein DnaA [Alphaproteobacteria bacterium]
MTQAPDLHFLWQRVRAKLRFRYGEAAFNSWLKPLECGVQEGAEMVLYAPTRFLSEWVQSHYIDGLAECWKEEITAVKSITIRTGNAPQQVRQVVTDEHERAVSNTYAPRMPSIAARPMQEEAQGANSYIQAANSPLDARFTFDNFITGPSNALAHAAARTVAESNRATPGSNPLFLHGGVGLGKTHLMHAVAHHIRETHPERKVVYMSAEKFMYQFIRAIRNKDVVEFKTQFRSVDVLMIDDVQFICGKDSTQEEFFHTLNALIDGGRQLVISADRSPTDLDGMEERIRSRLGWGLVADINTTTYELRLGILQSKAEALQVTVPPEVLEFLSRKITSNVRELEGALNKVVAHARIMQRDINLDTTQSILSDLLRANNRIITVEDIQKTVSQHYNIRMSDMHSGRRARNVARPRQMAMYLSKKLTPHSLPEIGRKFGGRDHTTVMHAVKRMEGLMVEDKQWLDDVNLLTRLLQS